MRRCDFCLGDSLDQVEVGGVSMVVVADVVVVSSSSKSYSSSKSLINIFSKSTLSLFLNVILLTSSFLTFRGTNMLEISLAVAFKATLRLFVSEDDASNWNESRRDARSRLSVTRRCCPS